MKDPLSFVQNVTAAADICQNCNLVRQHGMLLNPQSQLASHELIPIFSASKPSHFNDLLWPSPFYELDRNGYEENREPAWIDKENKFYFVGTGTGGHVTIDNWDQMQRQRLVLKTQSNSSENIQLLQETSPGSRRWKPRFSSMNELSDLFATRISNVVQCEEDACQKQREVFGIPKEPIRDPPFAAYQYRFLFDIGGNGFSGRYYRLLRSKSVVIKSTILKEWHNDRLIPWIHYITLSLGYEELFELARFLATTKIGRDLSERIARESADWYKRALRSIDMKLVWLRMILEYGWLMNPDRLAET